MFSQSQGVQKDFEVQGPPDDTISALKFSPGTLMAKNFLLAGSWDCSVRCWEVSDTGSTIPKATKTMEAPVLDVGWHDDGTKAFVAGGDKTARMWDLAADNVMQVAAHDNTVKTCHWVKAPNYSCLMTGSWDKTLKFWDLRQPNPIIQFQLPERCYTADVEYPMAIVGTANRHVIIYSLENQPQECKRHESPLKYQHRCVAIFNDKKKTPVGYAVGSIEGKVIVKYLENTGGDYTFNAHRWVNDDTSEDIFAINDIAFRHSDGMCATVGSDGIFAFWDITKKKGVYKSDFKASTLTKCDFNESGNLFSYSISYDYSKGEEHAEKEVKPKIIVSTLK